MKSPRGRFARVRRVAGRLLAVACIALLAWFGIAYARSTNDCAQAGGTAAGQTMKAYRACDYGPPSVLELRDIARPVPADSEVLVRVHAASVNPVDWHGMRGTPRIARLSMGLRKPAETRIGVDFAGVVESVGGAVRGFQPGDSVFGARTGAFAEYVAVRESRLVAKPSNVTLAQAAAVPVAALTALQGIRDKGGVRAGQKVLVNGASGGVGTFAVQIAKSMGAEVTGVCSTRNVELVKSLGADHVVDYTRADFTTGNERYDVIIDNVGNHSLSALRRVLAPRGKYVMIGGPSGGWIDPLPRVLALFFNNWFSDREFVFFISQLNQGDLATLRELMQSGQVTPAIDRTYPFAELPQAIEYLETGRARAKVVVTLE